MTGENGILSQVQNAKKVSENAAAEEKVRLEVMGSYETDGSINLENLIANLGNIGTVTKATFPVEVTVDGKAFTIRDTGVVEQSGPRINTSNLKVTTVADKETEITTSSTNKPEEGTPLEISFDVSISVGTITGVDKGTLTDGKVTYDTDGTETEVTFTFTLSELENNTPQTVTINNLRNYYKVKLYGAEVKLNGGSAITVKTVGTTNYTIEDNWRLFYIDDAANGYVHLIYGDYYPVNVQTNSDTESTINLISNGSYTYGVNSISPRLNLLKYLKNNSGYSSEATNLDNSTPTGSYASWTNLASALTGTGKALAEKTILIQGAPNITMWKNSWNEQGYTELVLGNTENGYMIQRKVASGTQSYNSFVDLKSENGYNDILYFPYKNNNSEIGSGYWLASPGGGSYGSKVCEVNAQGSISCNCYYDAESWCARPVVSILKSDFRTLFPNISIEK